MTTTPNDVPEGYYIVHDPIRRREDLRVGDIVTFTRWVERTSYSVWETTNNHEIHDVLVSNSLVDLSNRGHLRFIRQFRPHDLGGEYPAGQAAWIEDASGTSGFAIKQETGRWYTGTRMITDRNVTSVVPYTMVPSKEWDILRSALSRAEKYTLQGQDTLMTATARHEAFFAAQRLRNRTEDMEDAQRDQEDEGGTSDA